MISINDILSRISIESYYEGKLKFEDRKGKNWRAKCPFHQETSGSFYVKIDTGEWFCHGTCNEGGDLISFHRKMYNLDFNKCVRELAIIAGIEIPETKKKSTIF